MLQVDKCHILVDYFKVYRIIILVEMENKYAEATKIQLTPISLCIF